MKDSLRNLLLLCAVLPQLFLALCAPALVVCQEANGEQALELSFATCCAGEEPDADSSDGFDDDCGGCEDVVLSVSLQREDPQPGCADLSLASPENVAWRWEQAPHAQRVPARAPPLDLQLAALRSVVLRC